MVGDGKSLETQHRLVGEKWLVNGGWFPRGPPEGFMNGWFMVMVNGVGKWLEMTG